MESGTTSCQFSIFRVILKNVPFIKFKMNKLIYFALLIFSVSCGSKTQRNSQSVDSLAQYRDTIIGRFNGIEIDTLIYEPIDSLSSKEDGTYGGCHYEWRIYTTNGTVKDLTIENTIGIGFIKEGNLDSNETEEWRYVTQWHTSMWMCYHAFYKYQ